MNMPPIPPLAAAVVLVCGALIGAVMGYLVGRDGWRKRK